MWVKRPVDLVPFLWLGSRGTDFAMLTHGLEGRCNEMHHCIAVVLWAFRVHHRTSSSNKDDMATAQEEAGA